AFEAHRRRRMQDGPDGGDGHARRCPIQVDQTLERARDAGPSPGGDRLKPPATASLSHMEHAREAVSVRIRARRRWRRGAACRPPGTASRAQVPLYGTSVTRNRPVTGPVRATGPG